MYNLNNNNMKKLIFGGVTLLGVVAGFFGGKQLGTVRNEKREKQEMKDEIFTKNLKKREEIYQKIIDHYKEKPGFDDIDAAFRVARKTRDLTRLDNVLFKYL